MSENKDMRELSLDEMGQISGGRGGENDPYHNKPKGE